jgi:4-diphosphocytidyl-2-C-methyl-D-erythritol kinase
LHCPAKVNLALSVAAADPAQNHFHPLASWMVALRFGDTLTLRALAAAEGSAASRFDLRYAADAPCPGVVDWPLEKDLVYRAHALLEDQVARKLPVEVQLDKRIPTGAGLGGGSSDAAAALVGIDRLFGLGLGRETLLTLAARLGSDVPYLVGAMLGQTSAIVSGIGQQLTPAPRVSPIHLVLVFPGVACPTGAVYKAFDAAPRPPQPNDKAVHRLTTLDPLPPDAPFNDLAQPACYVQPVLGQVLDQLRRQNIRAHVTGSGSTLFSIAANAATAADLATRIHALTLRPTLVTQTM